MARYILTAIQSARGVTFGCPKCQAPGVTATDGTDNGEVRHLLICPVCRTTVSEWRTREDRERELTVLAEKLVRSLQGSSNASRETRTRQNYMSTVGRFLRIVKSAFFKRGRQPQSELDY
jgi:uncharacterized Zn finger protein (UPF0148 family)